MKFLLLILTIFASYAIGRVSHVLGGHLNTPHHWIYGVIMVVIGAFFYHKVWGQYLIAFGLGMIISDFKDMINLKFFGPDDVEIKKFWGFD